MDARQENDLRDAFEAALNLLKGGDDIARVEMMYGGKQASAVVLVIGERNTRDVVKWADKLIDKWAAAGESD